MILWGKMCCRPSSTARLLRPLQARCNTGRTKLSDTTKFILPAESYKLHRLQDGPPLEVEVTRNELLQCYKDMVTIREMERQTKRLYGEQFVRGFCHLYSGQEACAVGIEAAITKDDPVITSYRDHGWTYTRGVPVEKIIAELIGRSSGCSKGKGGSAHMFSQNFYGGHGIVGAQVPLGTGIAFALQYMNKLGRVCVIVYGDGAANQGQLFEAFNMAALWKLPCLFVCENNRYGMGTLDTRAAACPHLYTRGNYIPGIHVNGQNVLSVREATRWCIQRIQSGKGPVVMELDTYRYYGHSMSDPGKSYRSSEEVQAARKERDPIKLVVTYAIQGNLSTPDELQAIHAKAVRHVQEATASALRDLELPAEELYTDVYKDDPALQIRGCESFIGNHSARYSLH